MAKKAKMLVVQISEPESVLLRTLLEGAIAFAEGDQEVDVPVAHVEAVRGLIDAVDAAVTLEELVPPAEPAEAGEHPAMIQRGIHPALDAVLDLVDEFDHEKEQHQDLRRKLTELGGE